ncbi:methylaspartate mutase [Actinophytocola sp.]|uniref:methylaspartate mutase n=1 Tax=Actinophytocola sp. TaxID=1872138 RepID=UPI002ECFD889
MNFGEFVEQAAQLVVQPRMGFADPARMRAGLLATRDANATTVGTITLDSYTRVGDLASVDRALRTGFGLNGYPIVSHSTQVTRAMLDGVESTDFPVQVRHGSPRPAEIFQALVAARLHATEGGPVSYCLPYGRTSLEESVRNWAACRELAPLIRESGVEPHIETFGGCMMGQLCPPGLLVALSVLEALFFYHHGFRSISVSYAQQTNPAQDREAIAALRRLCTELLPSARWHVVVYAYMGLYPRTPQGALELLASAAELAVATGSPRLIVKTAAEAHRIPTIAENVAALEHAAAAARPLTTPPLPDGDNEIYREAHALLDAVLNCEEELGRALVTAFKRGLLDVPYCLHPDNAGQTRSYLDADGTLRWADTGSLPLSTMDGMGARRSVGSADLMAALSHVRDTFDALALARREPRAIGGRRVS